MTTEPSTSRKIGRPIEAVPREIADEILDWLNDGRSLLSWCNIIGTVSRSTIDNWRRKDPEFAEQFARAREAGNEVLEEEQLALADLEPRDMTDVAWHKLQIDTRQKILANRNPAKYGSKAQLAIGGDPNAPAIRLSVEERAQRVKQLMAIAIARRVEVEPATEEDLESLL